jgi:hydroxymethylglutaryl-CoA lyase
VMLPRTLEVREVGLRDGLQSRSEVIPTAVKVEMLKGLVAAGFRKINAVALVHPKSMPQMADAEILLEAVGPLADVVVSGLVLNSRGLDRALALHAKGLLHEVDFLHATTNSVLAANSFKSNVEQNQRDVIAMAERAKASGLRTLSFISASFGCSIEGRVDPEIPLRIAEGLIDSGFVDEICFSDSTGQANPLQVYELFGAIRSRLRVPITAHFHDSRGCALANVLALLQVEMKGLTVDVAFGGLGGDVPFLPQAAGNLCTEDLISMLNGCSIETGIDLEAVIKVATIARDAYTEPLPSHVLQVGPVAWRRPT